MSDLSQSVKALILLRLDSNLPPGMVLTSRIFPMKSNPLPGYPFIRYGYPVVRGYETNCGEGVDMDVRLHVFTEGEDSVQAVAKAVVDAVDGMPGFQSCDWRGTQFLPDGGEQDIWHAVVDFSVIHTD